MEFLSFPQDTKLGEGGGLALELKCIPRKLV